MYVLNEAGTNGKYDAAGLADFGLVLLAVEFWHVANTGLKHITHGPNLHRTEAGVPVSDADDKRFLWLNGFKLYLEKGRERTVSQSKEKMDSEFRDMWLHLMYWRITHSQLQRTPWFTAVTARNADSLDMQVLHTLFGNTLPLATDFVVHLHYGSPTTVKQVIARMLLLLHSEGRTGYRRCLLKFVGDIDCLPAAQQDLLLSHINCLCGVDIELIHGMLSAIIPRVHNQVNDQTAVDNCIRDWKKNKAAIEFVKSKHAKEKKHSPAYTIAQTLPDVSDKWIAIAREVITGLYDQVANGPTYTLADAVDLKIFGNTSVKAIRSENFNGAYPVSYCWAQVDPSTVFGELAEFNARKPKRWVPTPPFQEALRAYCSRPDIRVGRSEADQKGCGLSVAAMKKAARTHIAELAAERSRRQAARHVISSPVAVVQRGAPVVTPRPGPATPAPPGATTPTDTPI